MTKSEHIFCQLTKLTEGGKKLKKMVALYFTAQEQHANRLKVDS